MATKADVLKVMEMDKKMLLESVEKMEPEVPSIWSLVMKRIREEFTKMGLDTRLVGSAWTLNDDNYKNFVLNKELLKEIEENVRKRKERNEKVSRLKAKITIEFQKLERSILLEGAGVVATMLKEVVAKLMLEVENGI